MNKILSTNFYTGKFPIEESNLYISWQIEKAAIAQFAWLESEKAGYQLDNYRIDWLWWSTGRPKWLESIRTGDNRLI